MAELDNRSAAAAARIDKRFDFIGWTFCSVARIGVALINLTHSFVESYGLYRLVPPRWRRARNKAGRRKRIPRRWVRFCTFLLQGRGAAAGLWIRGCGWGVRAAGVA